MFRRQLAFDELLNIIRHLVDDRIIPDIHTFPVARSRACAVARTLKAMTNRL